MNTMVRDLGITARTQAPGEVDRTERPKSKYDTQTARIAYIFIDKEGVLKQGAAGHSWILLVQQKSGELIPQIGGGTYREEAFFKAPGGGVEDGETTVEAAVREFYQEAGILLPPDALDIDFSMEFEAASRRLDFKVPVGVHLAHWNTFFLHVTAKLPPLPLKTNDPKEIERVLLVRIRDVIDLKRKGLFGSVLAQSHCVKLSALFRQDKCLRLLRFADVQETDIRIMQQLRK